MIRFADNQNGYREFIQKVTFPIDVNAIIKYDTSVEKKIAKNGKIQKW